MAIHEPLTTFRAQINQPEQPRTISIVRDRQPSRSVSFHRRLSSALGLFSIGLGAVELFAPRALERWLGISSRHRGLIRMFGAREIATGVGILSGRQTDKWLSARVGGDAMDLATLNSFRDDSSRPQNLGIAAAAVAGVTALDVWSATRHCCDEELAEPAPPTSIRVNKTITVNCTPEEAYRFWHDFAGFPRFMKHLESVSMLDEKRSHWVAKGPAGFKVEWDAEITSDVTNSLISWRSLETAVVDHSGMVRFKSAPGGRGTVIYVNLEYRPMAGKFGAIVARLFGEEPNQQVEEDLRRFKQFIETGEIATTQGQSAGRSWWRGR